MDPVFLFNKTTFGLFLKLSIFLIQLSAHFKLLFWIFWFGGFSFHPLASCNCAFGCFSLFSAYYAVFFTDKFLKCGDGSLHFVCVDAVGHAEVARATEAVRRNEDQVILFGFHTKCVGSWSFFEERKETHGKILYVLWHGIGGG